MNVAANNKKINGKTGKAMDKTTKTTSQTSRDYSVFDAELSGKAFNLRLLLRLLAWLKPYLPIVILGVILILAAAITAVLMPVVISLVAIDDILFNKAPSEMPDFGVRVAVHWLETTFGLEPLPAACLLYALLVVSTAVLSHYARLCIASSILPALRDLRRDVFTHLERLPASFYDRVAVGRVMTRITNDVEVLLQLLAGFGMLIGELVPFFIALVIMISIYIKLTGYLMLIIPIVALATYLFRQATRRVYREIRNTVSLLNQNLQENLIGIQVVQLNRREDLNLKIYTGINKRNRRYENIAIELETVYGAFIDSMAAVGAAVIVWFGGGAVVQGAISLGSVVLFAQFADMLFRPVVRLGEQYNVLFRAMASGERIFQALDWDEKLHEPTKPADLPNRLKGHVEFRNLSFSYNPGEQVLSDVSFEIRPGEKLAIVGPTGAGKSTIIRLLGRFYNIERGRIFLDGVDLNDIRTQDLRRRIGVVLQDFHIFSGSVRDNIILNNPSISPKQAEEAAKLVKADAFIQELPEGYDTQLIERGQNLSLGQRQLLAFARVLAANPEILILDEATASIDTETELMIQEALRTLTSGRTSILIAHRLQTIQEADRILVLQNGRVREMGTHEELIAKDGLYHTLYALQFQSDEDAA